MHGIDGGVVVLNDCFRCAAIERKTFSFSSVCLPVPPPQATCMPKQKQTHLQDVEVPPGPISESTESDGPHFTIPSESAMRSPGSQTESVRISPVRGSRESVVRASRDSAASQGWNPLHGNNGKKKAVDDNFEVAELAAMKVEQPDKCVHSLLTCCIHPVDGCPQSVIVQPSSSFVCLCVDIAVSCTEGYPNRLSC